MAARSNPKRGLVIQGGGAKGAFALGCLRVFQRQGIEFSAVAGTSAGGLCAIIWSTQKIEEGIALWRSIDHSLFLGKTPDGCFRRVLKIFCIVGKIFLLYLNGVEPEGRSQVARDLIFSILVGILCWALTPYGMPTWLTIASLILIPIIAICAFTNTLPKVGWDQRVRSRIVGAQIFVGEIAVLVGAGSLLLELFRFIQPVQGFTWAYVGYNAAIVVVARAPMELRSTLLEGKLLAGKIVEFLSAEIKIPTFVTVAKEYGPGSPHFLLSTPGVFKAVYADLQRAPAQLKAAFAYASAALPLGILPEMTIDGKTFVDGGVADNTPITPILGQDVDEIWLISLSPTLFDLKDHMRNVLMQAIFVEGPPQISAEAYSAALSHFDKIKLVVFSPPTDLGNMLMGTLNFNAKRTNALMVLGERTAERVLRSGTGYSSRIYRLNYKFWTRLRLIRRALPPCSVVHPYKRSNISDLTKSEFEFPDVRVKPDEAGRPSWHASVIVLWSIYLGNSINSGWQSILWATLFGLVGLSLPTWRARMRRNLDK